MLPVTAKIGAFERERKTETSDSICFAASKKTFPSSFTPGFLMTRSASLKSSILCSPNTNRIFLKEESFSIDGLSSSEVFKSVTVTSAPYLAKN